MYRRIYGSCIQRMIRPSVMCNRRLPQLSVLRHYSELQPPADENESMAVPLYDTLRIHMKGYDFAVLESFAKYVHKVTDTFGLDTAVFPVPAHTSRVQIYKPLSSVVDSEYNLALYERFIEVGSLSSTLAPILIELLQTNIPAGVEMTIKQPDVDDDEFRYVPDLTLLDLKAQAAEIEKTREQRKKK